MNELSVSEQVNTNTSCKEVCFSCSAFFQTVSPAVYAPLTLHCHLFSIAGYFIPKNTVIIPNLFGAHHDPAVWPDPYSFKPGTALSPWREEHSFRSAQHFSNRITPLSFSLFAFQSAFWREEEAPHVPWCLSEEGPASAWGSRLPEWSSFCSRATCWEISSSSSLSGRPLCPTWEELLVLCSRSSPTQLQHDQEQCLLPELEGVLPISNSGDCLKKKSYLFVFYLLK